VEVAELVTEVVALVLALVVAVELTDEDPVVVAVLLAVFDWDVVAVLDALVVPERLADVVAEEVAVDVCVVVGEVAAHAEKSPATASAIAFVSNVAVAVHFPTAGCKSKSPLQAVVPFA
jgi:hypothetical protein